MPFISRIKSLLPGSSRSLHAMHEEMAHRFDDLYARLEQADNGINSNINYKFDCRLFPELSKFEERQIAYAKHQELRFEALVSHAYPGLSAQEVRCKIFESLPPAEGDMALVQRATAMLMNKLHEFCLDANVDYWFSYGSLVGALSRSGFIPWDDDIDICMYRSDINELADVVRASDEYQITMVYDWFVKCRQVRFSSTDPLNPCFVDISIYDHAVNASKITDDYLRNLRLLFVEEIESREDDFAYWRDHPWLFHPDSGTSIQCGPVDRVEQLCDEASSQVEEVERIFKKFYDIAVSDGFLVEDGGDAVAYAHDGMYNAPWRPIVWNKTDIFPVGLHPFESYDFYVPHNAVLVADSCYPGWPYMPVDIMGHEHFDKTLVSSPEVRAALEQFVSIG